MAENKYYLTQEAYDNLQDELQKINLQDMPAVLERVKRARDLGELEDNQEYEAARDAQNVVKGRLLEIEKILENAQVIEEGTRSVSGRVDVGSKVTVRVQDDDRQHTFTIVGSVEADPSQGKISHESPVGQKLLGLKEGDTVKVELPHATIEYKVIKIHK